MRRLHDMSALKVTEWRVALRKLDAYSQAKIEVPFRANVAVRPYGWFQH
jgi:hypothetical protein